MEAIIRRIEKLLALASNNPNEEEAASALAKAQALLEEHNLDMANLGSSGKGAQRKDTTKNGGLYKWQRSLWQAVSELNFCYYLSIKGLARGSVYEHRIIGSHANVVATEVMAKYLQETVERLAQRWAKDNFYRSVFVREAIAYREGMSQRICERLRTRRDEIVNEEKRKAEERKREQARHAAEPGTTALTILDVISTEADFNNDYLNGWELGTTARNRAKREAEHAAWREQWEKERAKQRAWDEANPEEAARRRKKEQEELERWRRKEERNRRRRKGTERYRKPTAEEERMGLGSYHEGRRKGEEVNLDQQVDRESRNVLK
jgi:hypothetical protein